MKHLFMKNKALFENHTQWNLVTFRAFIHGVRDVAEYFKGDDLVTVSNFKHIQYIYSILTNLTIIITTSVLTHC